MWSLGERRAAGVSSANNPNRPGVTEEGRKMFEAIFVLVSLAILVIEIIEVRHKCEQYPDVLWDGPSLHSQTDFRRPSMGN